MRFSVDSNILIYAFLRADERKHAIASELMVRAMLLDCVVPAQAIAEFLNVVRRKRDDVFEEARKQAERWIETFQIVETASSHVLSGAELAAKHKLQLWDSIIWQAARSAHATLFLSEDLQDGLSIEGMAVLNPFASENEGQLRALLSSADDQSDW